MAYTLFDATLDLSRILQDTFESTSTTNGTTTTLVDTGIYHETGFFSQDPRGTLWLKLATKASKIVTGHTTTTLTFTPAQSALVASGTSYAVAPGIYPKYALVQAINAALVEIGKIPYEGTEPAVANKESYTVTDNALFDEEIIGVEVASSLTAPYLWKPHYRWRQTVGTATSGARTFTFDEGSVPDGAYTMRFFYLLEHPAVSADSDVISSHIHPNLLKWTAAVHALRWRYIRSVQVDTSVVNLLNEGKETVGQLAAAGAGEAKKAVGDLAAQKVQEAIAMAQNAAAAYPIIRQHSPRHSRW